RFGGGTIVGAGVAPRPVGGARVGQRPCLYQGTRLWDHHLAHAQVRRQGTFATRFARASAARHGALKGGDQEPWFSERGNHDNATICPDSRRGIGGRWPHLWPVLGTGGKEDWAEGTIPAPSRCLSTLGAVPPREPDPFSDSPERSAEGEDALDPSG